jgi:hypothetical protein
VERSGEVEVVRTRAWSAIVRVPTTEGDLWLKEDPPSLAFEPELTQLLAQRRPDCLPEVVAAEGRRLLTRHVGPRLREVYEAGGTAPLWEDILPLYGQLQIDLAPDVEAALALGTPDFRLERFAELVAHLLSPEERGAVARSTEALGGTLPPMLSHAEAHDGNVFVGEGRPYLLDWAEAFVSHPFVGSVLMLRSATERNGFEPGSQEVGQLRDLYLEPFTAFAPLPELQEAYEHAYLLGALARALTWEPLAEDSSPTPAGELAPTDAWVEIFRELLAGATTLGGA